MCCCSVLQCVAVLFYIDLMCCCSVLQCVAVCCSAVWGRSNVLLQCVAVCCSVVWDRSNVLLQCVAACCRFVLDWSNVVAQLPPPSRSNRNFFCLGVQFVPRDLLHIPNSRKIFNVRMKVIFGEKSPSSLFRILRQGLTLFPGLFYHSKRHGKLIPCDPRASSWVWKMYSDFRCIFCWSLLGTAGPLRRRK